MRTGAAPDNRSVDLQAIHRDERGLVISWLIRLVVGFVLGAVVLFDVGSIVINYFTVNDTAQSVAAAVTADLVSGGVDATPNLKCNRRSGVPACERAYKVAREKGVRIISARFDQQRVFYVEVESTADTLIVSRISVIESWATATASADADTN